MTHAKIGIIGCGYWGPNLVRNYMSLPKASVIAVADKKPERLHHVKNLFPQIETIQDYHDLFTMNLDAVAIATPPASHFPIAKDCLEHGLHTFVEKPMTLSYHDAETLVDLAKGQGLILMVGHTFEYNPAVRKVKEIIESGELGKIYYVNTERLNLGLFQSDMNVLWDLAPHDLSILVYILGMEPVSVSVRGGACIFEGKHDVAFMYLEFPEQILAHIHVSWLDPCKVRQITVVGSQKMLVYDDVESLEKIRIYDRGVEKPPYTDTFGDFQCSYRYGDVVIPYIRFVEPLRIECEEFVECILDGHKEPQSCGDDGLRVVRILEAAQRSLLRDGESQPINSKQPEPEVAYV